MHANSTQAAKKYTSLSTAPVDILVQIQQFLDPCDIISIRKTCKSLYEATQSRSVWMDALDRVCVAQGVFGPSFVPDAMTSVELEHAALSPYRFAKYLTTNPYDDVLKPLASNVHDLRVPPSPDWPNHPPGTLRPPFWIPGGRFLVTYTSTGWVYLWDLGFPGYACRKPLLLTSKPFPAEPTTLDIQPTHDGQAGIRLLVVIDYEQAFVNEVLEIYPSSKAPEFKTLATLSMPTDPTLPLYRMIKVFGEGQLTFQRGNSLITVWNFIDNTLVTWNIHEIVHSLFVCDEEVIIVNNRGMSLWRIPPLQARMLDNSTNLNLAQKPYRPLMALNHIRPLADVPLLSSEHSWYPTHNRPFWFHLKADTKRRSYLQGYRLFPVEESFNGSLPRNIPVAMFTTSIPFPCLGDGYNCGSSLCDQYLTQVWSTNAGIFLNIATPPIANTTDLDYPSKTVRLWKNPTGSDALQYPFDICAMTGRLCILTPDQKICITEFIIPERSRRPQT